MNLIEQLGGYENVSKHFNRNKYHAETKIFIGEWFGFYSMRDLKDALLEYRRQHNIFEVGDWIIVDSYKPEYQFYQITKDDMGSHWINLVEFRHATDAEIKAGKRLEVNQ